MRKLALLTTTVIAALAMTASSAFAATEVLDPNTGEPCEAVTPAINASNAGLLSTSRNYESGGCTLELETYGQRINYGYSSTTHYSTCQVSFQAHVGPDGWGYADNFSYTGCSAGTFNSCAGDRLIAPRSYTGYTNQFAPYYSYTDANTDLNIELCSNSPSYGVTSWGLASMDITDAGSESTWTNQYDLADPYSFATYQRHRSGQWHEINGNYLTINHN